MSAARWGHDDTLPVPGATPLTRADWADLMTDVAEVYDARVGPTHTGNDLRAFAAWLRAGMPAPHDDAADGEEG